MKGLYKYASSQKPRPIGQHEVLTCIVCINNPIPGKAYIYSVITDLRWGSREWKINHFNPNDLNPMVCPPGKQIHWCTFEELYSLSFA